MFVCFGFFLFRKIKLKNFFLFFFITPGYRDLKTKGNQALSDIPAVSPSCPQDPADKKLNPKI